MPASHDNYTRSVQMCCILTMCSAHTWFAHKLLMPRPAASEYVQSSAGTVWSRDQSVQNSCAGAYAALKNLPRFQICTATLTAGM